ncbi:hypothetical protein, partial [Burkholderia cenocepacia]|uniref:hypothetical protein n=1 Tax=Burkholderia cenocepacia TaxID=95486 RepID=UPI0011B1F405
MTFSDVSGTPRRHREKRVRSPNLPLLPDMPAQFKTRPRTLVSALTCSVFLTPLLAAAETAPASAPAADVPATLPT